MSHERPSPFTIPESTFRFAEGQASEEPPVREMTVQNLIDNLVMFAEFYEQATARIERADPFEAQHHRISRDVNADQFQRQFRVTPGIERVRAYVLSRWGDELTVGTARRVLGDLIGSCALSVAEAGSLVLGEAADRLDTGSKKVAPSSAATNPEPPTVLSDLLKAITDAELKGKEAKAYAVEGDEQTGPATSNSAPDWSEMCESMRAVLQGLSRSDERLQGAGVADKAGYKYGTVRHHLGKLQTWGYIDRARDGYAITPAGLALVQSGRV